jgi:Zn ribbon nucleic-acid-binding protein
MKRKRLMITAALLAAACTLGIARTLWAESEVSSQECINCHTDLDRMDEYGAAASGGSAAIAG